MPVKAKNKSDGFMFKLPFILILFVLIFAAYKYLPKIKQNPPKIISQTGILKTTNQQVPGDWKLYDNKDYRFVIKIPPLLLERIYETGDEYLFFAKFEENKFSTYKGVGLGVTSRSIKDEVDKIKAEISKNYDQKPKESNLKVDGMDATKLEYSKKDLFEARSIVVVSNSKVTVSFSSTPEQIGQLVSSFDFY